MDLPPVREISALFEPGTDVTAVIRRLEGAGLARDDLAVCSPLPLDGIDTGDRFPMLPYVITIAAGILGIVIGLFFAGGTALLYPLETGGKPIVAPPVVGIISYETMMLLAILAAFATLLVRVIGDQGVRGTRDARIDDGAIGVVVRLSSSRGSERAVIALLEQAGASDITIHSAPPSIPRWEETGRAVSMWLLVPVLSGLLAGCSRDMEQQPAYQPQEAPRLHSPAGSIPRESRVVRTRRTDHEETVPLDAARLFRINCTHCHGPTGMGDGPVAGDLKQLPANLQAPAVQVKSEAEIYAILTDGKDMMPPFRGELSADERAALAEFVKRLPLEARSPLTEKE